MNKDAITPKRQELLIYLKHTFRKFFILFYSSIEMNSSSDRVVINSSYKFYKSENKVLRFSIQCLILVPNLTLTSI